MKLRGFWRIVFVFMMLAVLCFPAQGDDRTLNAFIQTLKEGNDSQARMEAAESLGALGDTRAVDPLIRASKDNNEYIRNYANDALVRINNHIKPKLTSMPDPDDFFRRPLVLVFNIQNYIS